jgi:hypothetical protein
MIRTTSIKLNLISDRYRVLSKHQGAYYADACNQLVPFVVENRCWNRVALLGNSITLYILNGRFKINLGSREHQRKILDSGKPKEAAGVFHKGAWYFNLVIESKERRKNRTDHSQNQQDDCQRNQNDRSVDPPDRRSDPYLKEYQGRSENPNSASPLGFPGVQTSVQYKPKAVGNRAEYVNLPNTQPKLCQLPSIGGS